MKLSSAIIITIIGVIVVSHLPAPLIFIGMMLTGGFSLLVNAPALILLVSLFLILVCPPLGIVLLILSLCAGAGE